MGEPAPQIGVIMGSQSDWPTMAHAVQILEEFGLPPDRIQEVTGRGDTEPFFPNDPYLSANQRVTITVLFQPPPVPIDLKP